jgi:hypothetical protein
MTGIVITVVTSLRMPTSINIAQLVVPYTLIILVTVVFVSKHKIADHFVNLTTSCAIAIAL